MTTIYASIPILIIMVSVLVRAELNNIRSQIYVFKPLSSLAVIGTALLSLRTDHVDFYYSILIATSLTISLAGDIALMFQQKEKAFKIGLGLFFSAHLMYAVTFMRFGSFSYICMIFVILMVIVDLILYSLFRRNLGNLKMPVIAYLFMISIMVISAVSTINSPLINARQAFMIAVGALLFFVSDLILAADRFWKPWKYNRIGLFFYYSGQLLLAMSASYFA